MLLGYARATEQDSDPDLQVAGMRAAGCDIVFVDSSTTRRLRQLDRAIRRLRADDTLVVSVLDHLGADLTAVLANVHLIDSRGAHLRVLDNGIDTKSVHGRAIFHVVSAIADLERAQRADRARRGMAAAKDRGKHVGRPRKLEAAQVKLAAQRIEAGEQVVELARSLNVSALTLRRALNAYRNELSTAQRHSA